MDSQNFLTAINQICDEKKISTENVLSACKEAIKAAYRKDFSFGKRDQNLEVLINPDSSHVNILLVKTVVEKALNNNTEISLENARKLKKDIKLGTKIKIDVTPIEFGRIASQSAKQVIIQKIREAEQKAIYDEYSGREDELLNAIVQRVDGRFVHLELDRTTTVLEPRDQIPGEKYTIGQRFQVYLEKVIHTNKGPVLRVSRAHPRFIARLLELEIPEIRNGNVVIKAIARDVGVRCKLVVDSVDPNIDPVGACVGQRGSRIQHVAEEVCDERIDVIEWSNDTEKLLKECLSPAKIDKIFINEAEKRIDAYVKEDQRAPAIGTKGQNVRLAGEILGYEIDILNTEELAELNEDTPTTATTENSAEAKSPAAEATDTTELPSKNLPAEESQATKEDQNLAEKKAETPNLETKNPETQLSEQAKNN